MTDFYSFKHGWQRQQNGTISGTRKKKNQVVRSHGCEIATVEPTGKMMCVSCVLYKAKSLCLEDDTVKGATCDIQLITLQEKQVLL